MHNSEQEKYKLIHSSDIPSHSVRFIFLTVAWNALNIPRLSRSSLETTSYNCSTHLVISFLKLWKMNFPALLFLIFSPPFSQPYGSEESTIPLFVPLPCFIAHFLVSQYFADFHAYSKHLIISILSLDSSTNPLHIPSLLQLYLILLP